MLYVSTNVAWRVRSVNIHVYMIAARSGQGCLRSTKVSMQGASRASHCLDNGKKQTSFFVVGDACREDVIAKAAQFAMSGRQQPSDSASEGECEQGDCSTIE